MGMITPNFTTFAPTNNIIFNMHKRSSSDFLLRQYDAEVLSILRHDREERAHQEGGEEEDDEHEAPALRIGILSNSTSEKTVKEIEGGRGMEDMVWNSRGTQTAL
jgi:hypothetical protein